MIDKYAAQGRIHFMHVRNVKILPDGGFEESAHFSACGSLDIVRILDILHRHRFNGYLRPDHGRMIWGETGPARLRPVRSGTGRVLHQRHLGNLG